MKWRLEAMGVVGPVLLIVLATRFVVRDGTGWFTVTYLIVAVVYLAGYFWSGWRRFRQACRTDPELVESRTRRE